MKILLATQKPFAKAAVDGIRKIAEENGHTLALLEKYPGEAELVAAVADADALIVRSDKVTAAVVEAAKNLKIVVRAGAGFDNLDLAACTAHNVVAMNTPGQNSNAVAELALGLMIYMNRNQFTPGTGSELKGKTLGIQAYGNVGRLVGKLAMGFGMNVIAFDPYLPTRRSKPPVRKSPRAWKRSTRTPTSCRCISRPRRRPRAPSAATSWAVCRKAAA